MAKDSGLGARGGAGERATKTAPRRVPAVPVGRTRHPKARSALAVNLL